MEKQKIQINRKILNKEKVFEVKADIIVPDIKPDIMAIINTNANTYIYKEEISSSKFRFDGNIDAYVIYLAENGETRSLPVVLDFSQTIEDELILENSMCKENIVVKNIETKILNERKITVVANLEASFEFFEATEIEFIKSIENDKIQKQEEKYNLRKIIGTNKSKASIKENVELDNVSNIAEILKTNVSLCNFENKVSYNKVLSKADAKVKIIYQSEEMNVGIAETTFPVMSFIDIDNVQENDICEVNYNVRNMLFKINSGISNTIAMQIDYEVSAEAYQKQEITIIEDMYSLESDIEFSKKDVYLPLDNEEKNEIIKIEENVMIEDIEKIIDTTSTIDVVNKTVTGKTVTYEAEIILQFIYESDVKTSVSSKTVKLPFIAKTEELYESTTKFKISNQEYKVNNENIYCNLEIELQNSRNSEKIVSILDNVEEKECENKNEYSLIVYFVKPYDTLWKIAKMFKVTVDSIVEANNIENPNKINVGDKLYIVK